MSAQNSETRKPIARVYIPERDNSWLQEAPPPKNPTEWNPSDELLAALLCRLAEWPLTMPIHQEKVDAFRNRIVQTVYWRGALHAHKLPRRMPRELSRREQILVVKTEILVGPRYPGAECLVWRLANKKWWHDPVGDQDTIWIHYQKTEFPDAVIHYQENGRPSRPPIISTNEIVRPRQIPYPPPRSRRIAEALIYSAEKIGGRVPPFTRGNTMNEYLSPLHVIAINGGTLEDVERWYQHCIAVHQNQGNADIGELISDLESTAARVLARIGDDPKLMDNVCRESIDAPLNLLAQKQPVALEPAPQPEEPAPQEPESISAAPTYRPPGAISGAPSPGPSQHRGTIQGRPKDDEYEMEEF